MKKIIYAWIEQVLEFDSIAETSTYLHKLENGYKACMVMGKTVQPNGKVRLHIRKQYNSNQFPEK